MHPPRAFFLSSPLRRVPFYAKSTAAAILNKMPPKKEIKAEKPLLGRPSNNLKMGVVGMPNVGKSSFFNALTNSAAAAENFPFCTIDPSEARVAVPDERFDWLVKHSEPDKVEPAYLSVIDIAGLVKGAADGEGLGNAFLSHIKAVDAIFHVVRAFSEPDVIHVEGEVDPIRDLEIIHNELRLKDIEFVGKQKEAAKKYLRGSENDKTKRFEYDTLEKIYNVLTEEKRDVRHGDWNAKEIEVINTLQLLTAKQVVYLVNLSQEDYIRKKNKWLPKIKQWIDEHAPGDLLIPFSVALESKVAALATNAEKQELLTSLGATSALPKIIVTGYQALQLIYYFTIGKQEVRAWTIRKGTKAPQAAGVIHSDFEKGFIMAEVMKYTDLVELGNEAAVKAAGKYMQKGKEYEVLDGDIIHFKFNTPSQPKKK